MTKMDKQYIEKEYEQAIKEYNMDTFFAVLLDTSSAEF